MIKSLTSLRGVFIFIIFFHHCSGLYPGGGTMAVTFFFVLGGFCMTLGYTEEVMQPEFDYKQYLVRRCIKLIPLHGITLIAAIPFEMLSFSWLKLSNFFINAALLQSWIPIKSVYFSFNAVSWYLADTMFFAIVFPFVLKGILRHSTRMRIFIAVISLTVYAAVAILIPKVMYHAILYISPYMRLFDFATGIFLALGYLKLRKREWSMGRSVGQIVSLFLIVLLVIESCLLPEKTAQIAVVYWPMVCALVFTTSLIAVRQSGGGNFCWKTNTCNALAS